MKLTFSNSAPLEEGYYIFIGPKGHKEMIYVYRPVYTSSYWPDLEKYGVRFGLITKLKIGNELLEVPIISLNGQWSSKLEI